MSDWLNSAAFLWSTPRLIEYKWKDLFSTNLTIVNNDDFNWSSYMPNSAMGGIISRSNFRNMRTRLITTIVIVAIFKSKCNSLKYEDIYNIITVRMGTQISSQLSMTWILTRHINPIYKENTSCWFAKRNFLWILTFLWWIII